MFQLKNMGNATAYIDLDKSVLPTLQYQFQGGPILCAPVNKGSLIMTPFDEFGKEEFKWPAQNSDFNPTDHHCIELEC